MKGQGKMGKVKTLAGNNLGLLTILITLFLMLFLNGLRTVARADAPDSWLFQTSFPISTASLDQSIPAVEGETVIYKSGANLFAKDMASGTEKQINSSNLSNLLSSLDIKSKKAMYSRSSNDKCQKDLSGDPNGWTEATENCIYVPHSVIDISATDDGNGFFFSENDLNGYGGIFYVDFSNNTW
jgi:hypothetical protein